MLFSYKTQDDESHAEHLKRSFQLAPHTRFEKRVRRAAAVQPAPSKEVRSPSTPPLPTATVHQFVQDDDAPIPLDVLRRALPSRFA